MSSNGRSISLPLNNVSHNVEQGAYRPYFFDLAEFNLIRLEFSTAFFKDGEAEIDLLRGDFSFCYLREDKLRKINVFARDSNRIAFDDFLSSFYISIKSKNLFKTGKYLSRVFRPVKYGAFFKQLDTYINHNPEFQGKVTDGISLISLELAKRVGWKNAAANKSAQLTLFYSGGLIKGHCVVSDKIKHDVIVFGNDNIKSEISLGNELQYVTLEPVKLGKTLRMDIQSLLNLWQLFGAEQFLSWTDTSIKQYEDDLFSGKLADWLDDFDSIDVERYDSEQWLLRKAIWHKVEYWRYPGLIRQAWSMFRNSIQRISEKVSGAPDFRIPVPGGKRGYIRVDLREHDSDGNFKPSVEQGEVSLDILGNLWIHPDDAEEFLTILGGGDMDDNAAIIPIEDNRAVIYRNPNQFGEYVIRQIKYEGISVTHRHRLVGTIQAKKLNVVNEVSNDAIFATKNKLLNRFISQMPVVVEYEEYTAVNLLRRLTMITSNTANIGIAANAEMIRSVIGIRSKAEFNRLTKLYNWNLERIIDATVKDGTDCKDDMTAVRELVNHVIENKIPVPKSIAHRFSEKLRAEINIAINHPLDELLEAVKYIVASAEIKILGRGKISKGNRVAGRIDKCDVPVIALGQHNIGNPLNEIAIQMLRHYNKRIAILLDKEENDNIRREGIKEIQLDLLTKLSAWTTEERLFIINSWAYEIYRSPKLVHDSIMWISSTSEYRGSAEDMLSLAASTGLALSIKKNGCVSRMSNTEPLSTTIKTIRVWSKEELTQAMLGSATEIEVVGREVNTGDIKIYLGDENDIPDGVYSIREVFQAYSRKNGSFPLKNSLTLQLR